MDLLRDRLLSRVCPKCKTVDTTGFIGVTLNSATEAVLLFIC